MTVRAPCVSRLFALCLTAVGLAAVAAGCRGSDSSTNVEEVAFASRNQQVEDFASRSRRFEDCCHHQLPPGRHRDECIDEARQGRCRLDCRPSQHEHDAGAPDAVAPTCPTLTPITTTPQDAGVIPLGGTIELSVTALDPSGGAAELSLSWNSTGGSFSGFTQSADSTEADGSATFVCTEGGTETITVMTGDASCTPQSINLTCSFCGDGIVESGEQCDPPFPGVCGNDCQFASVCGDGIIGHGEQCDPPRQVPNDFQCGPDCQFLTCGNGIIDPGEQCDPPRTTGNILCNQNCQIPTCGNGVIDPGETCDPPNGTLCDSNCQSIVILPGVCGDGIVEPGETCDFVTSNVYCQNCQATACGGCAFALCHIGQACDTLTGVDRQNCIALEGCLVPRTGSQVNCIVSGPSLAPCFCAVAPNVCSPTFTGQCVTQLEALAHTTDPATLLQMLSDPTSIFTAIGVELGCPEGAGCGRTCAGF